MGFRVTPGCFGSTRKSESPSGDRAGTRTTSATCAQGTKRFTPDSDQPPPARVAVAAVVAGSQSSESSSSAALARAWPAAMAESHFSFCAALPPSMQAEPAEHDAGEVGARVGGAPQLLEHQAELDQAEPRAALLLGKRQAEPAELGHLAPEGVAVALARSSIMARTCADLHCSSSAARTEFCSRIWSSVNEKFIAPLPRGPPASPWAVPGCARRSRSSGSRSSPRRSCPPATTGTRRPTCRGRPPRCRSRGRNSSGAPSVSWP